MQVQIYQVKWNLWTWYKMCSAETKIGLGWSALFWLTSSMTITNNPKMYFWQALWKRVDTSSLIQSNIQRVDTIFRSKITSDATFYKANSFDQLTDADVSSAWKLAWLSGHVHQMSKQDPTFTCLQDDLGNSNKSTDIKYSFRRSLTSPTIVQVLSEAKYSLFCRFISE